MRYIYLRGHEQDNQGRGRYLSTSTHPLAKTMNPPNSSIQSNSGSRPGNCHGEVDAFTLNVDLSGFTPLTESFDAGGDRVGRSAFPIFLNEVFEPLVALVYERGGIIPYFAG